MASFYHAIKDDFPIRKVLLYGSHAKGTATADSDIDIAVVVDLPDHSRRVEITSNLFHWAGKINDAIEPKCIFWDEYQHPRPASILAEIVRTGIELDTRRSD